MTGHIERIRVFIDVAERQSFAAAARALGLSRSVVTRLVSELEAELGVQLLIRTTRSVTLKPAGRLYLERTKALLADLTRAEELVRQQEQTLKGVLRVAAPLSFGQRFLPNVICQFRLLYPDIELKIDLSDAFVDILAGDVDVALRISAPPRDKSTIWRKLWVVPRTLVAAPSYLARRDTPQHPDQLERHDCLGYSNLAEGAVWDLRQVRTGASTSIALRSCFTCNNGDLLSDLAVRGEGIALLPNFITAPLIADRKLVEVLPDWRAPEIWLAAYYPPYDHIPAKVETFTRFIEANLSHRGHDGA